ncbi:MAG: TldD/PmbA family protein [Acidobacteria bacterium]|nr:TldD/PmbA family protein [Acidobacteriota bacterium]
MANLTQLATSVVDRAMRRGATAAECILREGTEFSTVVRLGQVETLKEASARAAGLRVLMGRRAASTYTSDLSEEAVERMISSALELARITSEDPAAGLPEAAELGQVKADLQLYFNDVVSLPPAERIAMARRAEEAAMQADARITNSEGGSFEAATSRKVLVNSAGFTGQTSRSYCGIMATPVAQQNGAMQRDYWWSSALSLARLDSPEHVGRIAAERTVRRLGARKVRTQKVPVVFDPQTARALVELLAEAVNGDAVYRSASYLAGKLGQVVAGPNVTVFDDGAMPGGFGSAPFDGEGVPTRRTVVLERGQLKSYLLNTYTARKLGLRTTGNASRSLTGNPGIGTGNFYLAPGEKTPRQIIAGVPEGLYVTDFLGMGVNLVTGDFSRGASGIWISGGELAYPVEEITVGGNLAEMFSNVAEIGNDLEFRTAVASPTIRIEGMTVAGE